MPKRYYCDHCNKSFQDNPRNRSKHVKGFLHLRNKEMHYSSVQRAPPSPKEQQRLLIFQSSASGEKLFQQWLDRHPDIVRRFDEMSKAKTILNSETHERTDSHSEQVSSLDQESCSVPVKSESNDL